MLRFIVLAAATVCCTSFRVPASVRTHRSSLEIRHEGSTNKPLMDCSKRAKYHRLQPCMSSKTSPPPTPPPPFSPDQAVDRRTLLTKTLPAALAVGAIGVAGMAAAGPELAYAAAAAKPAPKGTKVVVLGGNGFVGSKVCELLVEAGELSSGICSNRASSGFGGCSLLYYSLRWIGALALGLKSISCGALAVGLKKHEL